MTWLVEVVVESGIAVEVVVARSVVEVVVVDVVVVVGGGSSAMLTVIRLSLILALNCEAS
jgi:hypothetical protein